MPISLFELVVGWLLIGSVFLGLVTLFVGIQKDDLRAKVAHAAVAFGLPAGFYAMLIIISA